MSVVSGSNSLNPNNEGIISEYHLSSDRNDIPSGMEYGKQIQIPSSSIQTRNSLEHLNSFDDLRNPRGLEGCSLYSNARTGNYQFSSHCEIERAGVPVEGRINHLAVDSNEAVNLKRQQAPGANQSIHLLGQHSISPEHSAIDDGVYGGYMPSSIGVARAGGELYLNLAEDRTINSSAKKIPTISVPDSVLKQGTGKKMPRNSSVENFWYVLILAWI